ncbi:MAG: chorismate synthase [Deltaproteobacteria bacterium]|nr:chorismate synthase [Deltaproteobacteria bacterium]
MAGNTIGQIFKVTTYGESHGIGVGAVIDGCPPGIPINNQIIRKALDKRKTGASIAGTNRKEPDPAEIISGTFKGVTSGTPIMIFIPNKEADSEAYKDIADIYRPGHGDITYMQKYKIRDWRGGGRASARETVARVAAGAVAKAVLNKKNISVKAYTIQLGNIRAKKYDFSHAKTDPFLCPDQQASNTMEQEVEKVKKDGDSLGGIVEIIVKGVIPGLGEPVFDKLDADIAKAVMSIGAVKGVEIGSGFYAALMKGSENNDSISKNGFATNNAGGILAGISNGDDIIIRAAVKPIPSIRLEQKTIDEKGNERTISIQGRHDISAIPRINSVCEAMVSITLADHLLRQRAIR